MRRCTGAALRNCSAANVRNQWIQPYVIRQYTTSNTHGDEDGTKASTAQNESTSPNASLNQEAIVSNKDGIGTAGSGSLDINQTEKTIKTTRGRKLPLSPVMDPSYWEAKQRHHKQKADPRRPRTEMERMVSRNPFAKALATSIRLCTASKTRLPRFFLQEFKLLSHPETQQPWWVPRSLAPGQPPPHLARDENSTKNKLGTKEYNPSWDEDSSPAAGQPDKGDKLIYAPAGHVLARKDLIHSFTVKKSGFDNHNKKIYGPLTSPYKNLQKKAIWREDMDEFMLDLMRDDICSFIHHLAKVSFYMGVDRVSERHIVPFTNWDDLNVSIQGAVLWFGDNGEATDPDSARQQPGPLATYDVKNGAIQETILVHNMPLLLGAELAEKLKTESIGLNEGTMFYLAGTNTTRLQYKLWRLQGYLFPDPQQEHSSTT
ncbi:hypothetical protein F4810DRAFT_141773 [Camillea tinctor]|nr:hypothetical protein F4810DRAFT_141773 [Camillea tinctor]